MSGTKIVVIVVVLVLVLFVVLVVCGHGKNGHNVQEPQDWREFKPEDQAAIRALGNFFGSPGPKLKTSELEPNPGPILRLHPYPPAAAGKFILNFGDRPARFTIAPDDHHQYRQATFAMNQQKCAGLKYWTLDGSGGKLHQQCWPNNCESGDDVVDPKNPSQVTFQVLSPGGALTISLNPGCTVQLE